MKKVSVIVFVGVSCAYSQNKSVTVTGCVYSGAECLRLKDSKGKQDYSIVKSDSFQLGRAYRITGVVSDFGFCQEGKPMLAPEKVTRLRRQCRPEPKGEERK